MAKDLLLEIGTEEVSCSILMPGILAQIKRKSNCKISRNAS